MTLRRMIRLFGVFFVILAAATFVVGLFYGEFVEGAKDKDRADSESVIRPFEEKVRPDRYAVKPSPKETRAFIENAFPIAEFRPVRKEGAGDFTLPTAHASLLLDADSGTILHYNKAKERRQIASLTKMMTALLVMEKVRDLSEPVTITAEMLDVDGTIVGCPRSGYCIDTRLRVGEQVRVEDLLKAMLMNSANDAATALGIHVGGSFEKFVVMMNDRARDMGLKDSNFCTPSGLEIDGRESECYSTAYDIARIAAQTVKYDRVWEFMRHPVTHITSVDKKLEHRIITTNELIGQYPNLLGTKTGFTPSAGKTLLGAATDPSGKHRVIAVLLNDPYRWGDIKSMFDWSFGSYIWK